MLTCEFQVYRAWGNHRCIHPKREREDIDCDGQALDCSHREMMRNGCDIARIYFKDNVKSIPLNTVKACRYIDDCKRGCVGKYPECSKKDTKEWAERYQKEFEVEMSE